MDLHRPVYPCLGRPADCQDVILGRESHDQSPDPSRPRRRHRRFAHFIHHGDSARATHAGKYPRPGNANEETAHGRRFRQSTLHFTKDISTGEWTGAAVAMAKSIADVWSAQLVFVETTFGNSVLDVQSNKIDIAFALNPTPQRALAIGFTRPSGLRVRIL